MRLLVSIDVICCDGGGSGNGGIRHSGGGEIKMKAIWVNMVICTVLIVYLSGILDVAGLLIAKITRRHHD